MDNNIASKNVNNDIYEHLIPRSLKHMMLVSLKSRHNFSYKKANVYVLRSVDLSAKRRVRQSFVAHAEADAGCMLTIALPQ